MYPSTSKYSRRGTPIAAVTARLVLWGSLAWAADRMRPSEWNDHQWERVLAILDPREVCVLALHGIRGLTHTEVGAWLGGLSRGTSSQLWEGAMRKLRQHATELTA